MTSCPVGSITYNATLCACPPGQFLNRTTDSCTFFTQPSDIVTDIGLANTVSFPETVFSFDSIKKFTQSQAVFLEATCVVLVIWLLFCLFLRFRRFGDGQNIWFRIRWWISRLDVVFATRHWLDDQQVVVKRKTELGGAFSMASWILFIGLFAALLYQIIAKRSIEVHNVRATNAPDLASFANDMELNITAISSMSCSNLRGLGTLVTGNPGFIVDYRVVNLGQLVNYTCRNTSTGPTLSFKCTNCRISKDYMLISFQFVDLPNAPASAVGYHFNLTTRNHDDKRHFSFVSGTLKNGSAFDDTPVTFRGTDPNILKFNLFPRIYHDLGDLKLIQPLFHEFIPGSFFRDTAQLQASLATSTDGLINTTLYVQYLSSYVVEIEKQNIMGPVSFLADLGGLYCISICIFFYLLVQCEYRVKKLRNEDTTMRNLRNRLKAQIHWDKLRKYVRFRWGCKTFDEDDKNSGQGSSCCILAPSVRHNGSIRAGGSQRGSQRRTDGICLNKKASVPCEKNVVQGHAHTEGVKSTVAGCTYNTEGMNSDSALEHSVKGGGPVSVKDGTQQSVNLLEGNASKSGSQSLTDENVIPLPPPLEFKNESEVDISDIQKNLQHMYDYNVMLREKLVATQSLLNSLATKSSIPSTKSRA